MSDLATLPPSPALAQQAALDAAKAYAHQALSDQTLRAYRADWEDFCLWCRIGGWQHLPADPTTVAAYLGSLAKTHSRATLKRRLAGIGQYHKAAGYEWNPGHSAIRNTLKGIQRKHGTPARRAAALTTAEIRKLVAVCDDGLTGSRDRALILLGFAGALRRGELVAIHRDHITFTHEGMRLLIPRAKTDQAGQGFELGIPKGTRKETCPVRAMEIWLRVSRTEDGPVFRRIDHWGGIDHTALHPDAVRQILKRLATKANITVPSMERLSPHGLRAGFVTEAYKAGARDEQIMEHTRHRDLKTMRGYVRRAKLMMESPVKLLGL
jgi:integrase